MRHIYTCNIVFTTHTHTHTHPILESGVAYSLWFMSYMSSCLDWAFNWIELAQGPSFCTELSTWLQERITFVIITKCWKRCNRVLQLLLWFGFTRSCIDLLTVLVVDMGCPLDSLAGIVTHRLLRKSKDTTKSHSIFTASLFWVVEGLGMIIFDFILFLPMVD